MYVLIVGGGKVGVYLAALLLNEGHRVRVIEARPEELPALQRDLPAEAILIGNGSDAGMLENAGIRQANVVAAVTGADETNLAIASLARFEFHVPRVIARVNNPRNAWMFTHEMGVDVALNQADLMARLILEEMSLGDMTTLLKLRRGQYVLVEEKVHPDAPAVGQAVCDLKLPAECVLAAIIRRGQLVLPHGQTVLEAGDEVLAIIHMAQADRLVALLGAAG